MDQTNPVPSMQHIFVSYSRADSETVDAIVSRLKRDGFDVWLDRKAIMGGDIWSQEIVKAVGNAYAFLLLLSPSAAVSKYVRQEVYLAFEGNKYLVPMKLAPVEIPASIHLQLAGVQWIEYYRDPDARYAELVNVMNRHKPSPTPTTLAVAFVLQGLNRFNTEKQAQLLDSIANFTGTPHTEFEITKPIDRSGHMVVKMPADAAYQLKTAALNSDMRLLRHGIKGLRLTGDRDFILVRSGDFASFKLDNLRSRWFIAGSALLIALLIALITISRGLTPSPPPSTVVPTATNTITLTLTGTSTITPTPSYTPTRKPTQAPAIQNPIVSKDDLCRGGPDTGAADEYPVISGIARGTSVSLVGRGNTPGWLIVNNPRFNVPCWFPERALDGVSDNLVAKLPTVTAGPTAEFRAIETIDVPLDNTPKESSKSLVLGVPYRIEASGRIWDQEEYLYVDAEYAFDTTINPPVLRDKCFLGTDRETDIGIGINDALNDSSKEPRWGGYNEENIYRYPGYFIGEGNPIVITYHTCYYNVVLEFDGNTFIPLRITIYEPSYIKR
jgi:hypothetical protein